MARIICRGRSRSALIPAMAALVTIVDVAANSASSQTGPDHIAGGATVQAPVALSSPEEVVVTARKRAEKAQTVPTTINVLSSKALDQNGVVSLLDLQSLVPSLSAAVADRSTNVSIRGISNTVRSIAADPSNAVNLDGVYLPYSSMILSNLFDVSRVEIEKGPQNLYGRNATGGAINVISTDPAPGIHAEGFVGGGSLGLFRTQNAASIGTDTIAVRLAVDDERDNGYTKDLIGNRHLDNTNNRAFRGTVKYTPTTDFTAKFSWQHSSDNGTLGYGASADPAFNALMSPSYPLNYFRLSPRTIRSDALIYSKREDDVAGLTLEKAFDDFSIRSITGYTRYSDNDSQDNDNTSSPYQYQQSTTLYHSYSEEIQAFSTSRGVVDWVAGLFLYKDDGAQLISIFFNPGAPSLNEYSNFLNLNTSAHSTSQAAYGQITYHFLPDFALVVGGRITHDQKTGIRNGITTATIFPSLDLTETSTKFTPNATFQWTPTKNLLAYASATNGYKSGGINDQDTAGRPIFKPESIWAYEVGVKSESFSSHLTLNVSGFYYNYKDIQLRTAEINPGGRIRSAVTNASSATLYGSELQAVGRFDARFSVDATLGYLASSIHGYLDPNTGADLTGLALPLSPKFSGTAGANYQDELGKYGSVRGRIDYTVRSSVLFPNTYGSPYSNGPGYGLLNATVRWTEPKGHYYVEGLGRNMLNRTYLANQENNLPLNVAQEFGPPQTFELRLGYKF